MGEESQAQIHLTFPLALRLPHQHQYSSPAPLTNDLIRASNILVGFHKANWNCPSNNSLSVFA